MFEQKRETRLQARVPGNWVPLPGRCLLEWPATISGAEFFFSPRHTFGTLRAKYSRFVKNRVKLTAQVFTTGVKYPNDKGIVRLLHILLS